MRQLVQPALLLLELDLALAQGDVQLLDGLGVRASRREQALLAAEPASGSSETRRTASSRAWRAASARSSISAIRRCSTWRSRDDRLLGVAQRLALGLQLGLDAIGAGGEAGDLGLALVDADLAQLQRVVALVELALALVQRVLAAVEPLLAALDVVLGERDAGLALAQVGGQPLDLGLGLLLGV